MQPIWTIVAANVVAAAAMAVAVALASRVPPIRRHPRLRHALWLLVVAKLVTPAIVELPILPGPPTTAPADATYAAGAANAHRLIAPVSKDDSAESHEFDRAAGPQDIQPAPTTRQIAPADGARSSAVPAATSEGDTAAEESSAWILLLVAFAGLPTVLLLAANVWQIRRASMLIQQAEPGDPRLCRLARAASRRMGVGIVPEICVVSGRLAPLLWIRRRRPIVVLPEALAERLSDEHVECIVCHELAHFVRRDHWTNAFTAAVTALYWWNPVAWWARRQLLSAQEECCDAMVIGRARIARRRYAETLWHTIEYVNEQMPLLPASASGFGRVSLIQRRFEMIASKRVNDTSPAWAKALLLFVAAALCCLPVEGNEPATATDKAEAAVPSDPDAKARPGGKALQAAAAKTFDTPGDSTSASKRDARHSASVPAVSAVDQVALKYRVAEVTVDPKKHCMYLGQPPASGQGALRVDLERGVTYTVRATGKAFMSDETGDNVDPFPGVMLFYCTDEEDGFAVRQAMLKSGESITFTTPWAIDAKDEVFASAFFIDAWADSPNHGGYTLTFTRSDKETASGLMLRHFYGVYLPSIDGRQ